MTLWREENWGMKYKVRFGADVYTFIQKDSKLVTYLSDYDYITSKLKSTASQHQLDDNSMFVLHICKFFEGVLKLIADETGWYQQFNKGKGTPIRMFYVNNRAKIETEIKQKCPQNYQIIIDKLFSTVGDFNDRHEAVHYGSLIKIEEIDNYDAILTEIKKMVKILIDNNLL